MMNVFAQSTQQDDFKIVLGDLGQACILQPGETKSDRKGTLFFMAPEVIQGLESDFSADIWSLGVLLYAMICDEPPFSGANYDEIYANQRGKSVQFEHENWQVTSNEVQDLVKAMLQVDKDKRLTIKQVIQHPWLS